MTSAQISHLCLDASKVTRYWVGDVYDGPESIG